MTKHVVPVDETLTAAPTGLVDARVLTEILWPDPRSRPCVRTVRRWQELRLVPHIVVGRRIYFDPTQVRRALDSRFTVTAR
jgi:hypothetical protein